MSGIATSRPPAEVVDGEVVASRPSDRPALLRLVSDDQVGRHVGGSQDPNRLESVMPHQPGDRPGFFVIGTVGEVAGIVTIDPFAGDAAEQAPVGVSAPAGVSAVLGYMLLPEFWGRGIATTAGGLVVGWWDTIGDGSVPATAQAANIGLVRVAEKVGSVEQARFEHHGALQWRGMRLSAPVPRCQSSSEGPCGPGSNGLTPWCTVMPCSAEDSSSPT